MLVLNKSRSGFSRRYPGEQQNKVPRKTRQSTHEFLSKYFFVKVKTRESARSAALPRNC